MVKPFCLHACAVFKKRGRDTRPLSLFVYGDAAPSGHPLLLCFLVSRFAVSPVAEITTGSERLLLCLGLRPLNDDLTAVKL